MSEIPDKSPAALPRVFVIGFNKCGTRTIHWYFKNNGYSAIHWDKGRLASAIVRNLIDSVPLLTGYEEYSVFSDMEKLGGAFPLEAYKLFRYLDAEYAGSVFILNTRDIDRWIASRLEHGNGGYARRWKRALDISSDANLISHWREDWKRHHENVERYFERTKSRFLKFNIDTDSPGLINHALPEYCLDPEKYETRGRTAPRQSADDNA